MSIKSDPNFFADFAKMEDGLKKAFFSMKKVDVISVSITPEGIAVLMKEDKFFELFSDIASEPVQGTEGFMFTRAEAFGMMFTAFFKQEPKQ